MEVERRRLEESEKKQRERLDKEMNYDAANMQIHAQVRSKRYDEDSIWKSSVGAEFDEFQIDTKGSNLAMASSDSTSFDPSSATLHQQQQHMDRNRIQAQLQQQQQQQQSQSQAQKKRKPNFIIVPPGFTSLITLFNAKYFLQEGQYISTEEAKKKNPTKPEYVVVRTRHQQQQGMDDVIVIDNVSRLSKEDWSRVIGVFVTGQTWQFKGWFSEEPSIILNRIKGFHVKFSDDPLNENIAKWPVTVLEISKNETKRHLDRTVVRMFWDNVLRK